SVLENDYDNKQVIVVDDGSTDNTYEVASRYRDRVLVLRRPRSGLKAYALNYGLRFADGDIVVTLDADTLLSRDALRKIAAYFQDERIVAACGNLRVLNSENNFLTKLQSYEYIIGFEIGRRLQALFRTLLILPGAMTVVRRKILESLGGYDPMIGEDFDLTLKFHKIKGRLEFMHDVYSWTEVPNDWKSWFRQRMRWHRSQIRVLIRHRNIFLRRIFGPPGLLGAPDMVLMDFIALILRPTWILYFLLAYNWMMIAAILALFYFITELHALLAALSIIEYPEDLKHPYVFALNLIFYRPIYSLVRLYSYVIEIFRPSYQW
ncbi:MAG: glycosyltransferase, partial [Thaumarchaeota archaeon]|nr:glycosyltransferase [Nitrososphaerota archaeon]